MIVYYIPLHPTMIFMLPPQMYRRRRLLVSADVAGTKSRPHSLLPLQLGHFGKEAGTLFPDSGSKSPRHVVANNSEQFDDAVQEGYNPL